MTHPVSPDSIDALPQWASHKVIIPDHVLAMGNDLAFELVERMIETRITEQPHIIVRSFERHASLVIIFLTNDASHRRRLGGFGRWAGGPILCSCD